MPVDEVLPIVSVEGHYHSTEPNIGICKVSFLRFADIRARRSIWEANLPDEKGNLDFA